MSGWEAVHIAPGGREAVITTGDDRAVVQWAADAARARRGPYSRGRVVVRPVTR